MYDAKKTLLKVLRASAIAAASMFVATLAEQAVEALKGHQEVWAVVIIAAATALLDWLKHRSPR